MEARGIQNGRGKTPTSPIRLSNESFFFRTASIQIIFAVFGSARMLLKAACERRGVHFSATLSEPSPGCFLHPSVCRKKTEVRLGGEIIVSSAVCMI